MKKIFIYTLVIGGVAGVVCWIYRKGKSNTVVSRTAGKKVEFETATQKEKISQNNDTEEKIYQAKSECAQNVYERHAEAGAIMKDVYRNIMEDFVEDFSDEIDTNENKEVVIDNESVSVIEKIDSISKELDDLLK